MATFERDPVIATLAGRASDQVKAGTKELHDGNLLSGLVYLAAAQATLTSLAALIDGTAPARPMRKLAVVGAQEDRLPEWMTKKHNGPDGAA